MAVELTTVSVETTIADADEMYFNDVSETPDALNRITWANIKSVLSTWLGSTYALLAGSVSQAFAASTLDIGNTDTTISRVSAGDIGVEGNRVFRVGGADVPVADGGTGLSSGTSGGVLAFTASGTLASSGALAANAIVIGGGAGVAPSTTTTGTGVLTALGANVGSAGAVVTFNGALGTPSSGTLTNCTGLPVSGITASTSTALGVGSLEIGHASDTTLARVSAGVASIEGKNIQLASGPTALEAITIAVSDETTELTTGASKVTFRMPFAMTLTAVRSSITNPPTGSVLTVDINESGASILSTKLTIDATEYTSTTAATAAVISDTSLADDAEIKIDIDGVGSSYGGAGLKVTLIGYRT